LSGLISRLNERQSQKREGSPERIGAAFFAFDLICTHGTKTSAKNKFADTI